MRRRPRPVRLLAASATAALLLTGCTGSDEPESDGSVATTVSADEAQAAEETTEDLRADAGEDAEPQPVTATLPVLGSRQTTAGETPLQIDLNDVSVAGEVMTVLFTVRNLAEVDDTWQIASTFDDGTGTAPLDGDGEKSEEFVLLNASSTDGVTVIDTANGMMHRAAYDTAGNCACNVGLSGQFIGPGEAMVLTTAFAAPPEDVDTVTVQIPGAGSFDDVPLSR